MTGQTRFQVFFRRNLLLVVIGEFLSAIISTPPWTEGKYSQFTFDDAETIRNPDLVLHATFTTPPWTGTDSITTSAWEQDVESPQLKFFFYFLNIYSFFFIYFL